MPRPAQPRGRRTVRRFGGPAAAVVLVTILGASGCAGAASDTAELEASPAASLAPPAPEIPPAAVGSELMAAEADEHSEVGTVVDGFPLDLLPLPPDAMILVTSAVPVGDAGVREVSLNVRTAAQPEDVLDLYREALLTVGFTEVTVEDTALAAESTFVRSGGDELISIGVLDDGGVRTVTIGGRVRTEP